MRELLFVEGLQFPNSTVISPLMELEILSRPEAVLRVFAVHVWKRSMGADEAPIDKLCYWNAA